MGLVRVRLTPRADRDAITAVQEGIVHVRVTAPPVEGRANDTLRKLLARALGVPRSRVEVVRGQASRDKAVEVDGLDAGEALRILETIVTK